MVVYDVFVYSHMTRTRTTTDLYHNYCTLPGIG